MIEALIAEEWKEIVLAIAAVALAYFQYRGNVIAAQSRDASVETKDIAKATKDTADIVAHQTNSMHDRIVKAERAEGVKEGIRQERARDDNEGRGGTE